MARSAPAPPRRSTAGGRALPEPCGLFAQLLSRGGRPLRKHLLPITGIKRPRWFPPLSVYSLLMYCVPTLHPHILKGRSFVLFRVISRGLRQSPGINPYKTYLWVPALCQAQGTSSKQHRWKSLPSYSSPSSVARQAITKEGKEIFSMAESGKFCEEK